MKHLVTVSARGRMVRKSVQTVFTREQIKAAFNKHYGKDIIYIPDIETICCSLCI